LRLEKELVCAPCRHAKMLASSHPPPYELLHMDLVGPARVRSVGGSGMSLLWWTTTLGMRGCSFSRIRGDVWFCSRSCLEVKERDARRCHTRNSQ
jgi:hypothetical protein